MYSFIFLEASKVTVGSDNLFSKEYIKLLKNKSIGIITNHTAINSDLEPTSELLKKHAATYQYTVSAFFSPEHGINGSVHANDSVKKNLDDSGIPIYSLYNNTPLHPTQEMLQKVNLLIYDIQDIGSRSYTYATTLYYAMESAAKYKIPLIVLDRPNPINGLVVDGPMLEEKWRSVVGYINVPYCHGMTIAELAQFFNREYKIGCQLTIVPMTGWKRNMSFMDTGLTWIPTSPHIPEPTTAFYYPMTGLLGELNIVSTGVGYTLPFKLIGAPWIEANVLAKKLNQAKYPGVRFIPFHYKPFFGRFAKEECHGVKIIITDPTIFKPVSVQYLIISELCSLYPEKVKEGLETSKNRKRMFCLVNGTETVYEALLNPVQILQKLNNIHQNEKSKFLSLRKAYLLPQYLEK